MKEVVSQWEKETGVRVVIVSIDAENEAESAKSMVEKYDWPFEVLHDPNQELFDQLNGGNKSVPRSFFFDRNGKLHYSSSGAEVSKEGVKDEDVFQALYGDKKSSIEEYKADLSEYHNYIKKISSKGK